MCSQCLVGEQEDEDQEKRHIGFEPIFHATAEENDQIALGATCLKLHEQGDSGHKPQQLRTVLRCCSICACPINVLLLSQNMCSCMYRRWYRDMRKHRCCGNSKTVTGHGAAAAVLCAAAVVGGHYLPAHAVSGRRPPALSGCLWYGLCPETISETCASIDAAVTASQ